jgi:hypothetical protein
MVRSIALAVAAAAAAAPGQAAEVRACGTSLAVSFDAASFTDAGRETAGERLASLSDEIAAVFQAEAAKLCEGAFLGAQDFVGLQGLLVQNGEGAAEPTLHRGSAHPGKLVFQYAFGTGGAPDAAAVEKALRCWRRPDQDGCYED